MAHVNKMFCFITLKFGDTSQKEIKNCKFSDTVYNFLCLWQQHTDIESTGYV